MAVMPSQPTLPFTNLPEPAAPQPGPVPLGSARLDGAP
jgi:hypothetical protein